MSKRSDKLAFESCARKILEYIQNNIKAAASIGRVIAGDLTGIGAAGDALGAYVELIGNEVLAHVSDDKTKWAGFLVGHLVQGTLLLSSVDPYSWYRATHAGSSCSGSGRITTTKKAKWLAEVIGGLIASPSVSAKNSIEGEWDLIMVLDVLNSSGMDGLQPVRDSLLRGYRNMRTAIANGAHPVMSPGLADLVGAIHEDVATPGLVPRIVATLDRPGMFSPTFTTGGGIGTGTGGPLEGEPEPSAFAAAGLIGLAVLVALVVL